MEYRLFGRTGVKVSPVCLGAMNFGGVTNESDSLPIIHAALAAGINFIDTANVYNAGQSEAVVGKALKGRRDSVFLATKAHGKMGDGPNDEGLSRLHLMRAVDDSLRRLQTDYIDLYQMHRARSETSIDETKNASKIDICQICHSQLAGDKLSRAEKATATGSDTAIPSRPRAAIMIRFCKSGLFGSPSG